MSHHTRLAIVAGALLLSSITGCASGTASTTSPSTLDSAALDDTNPLPTTPSSSDLPISPHDGKLVDGALSLEVDHSIEHLELGRKTVRGHVFLVVAIHAKNNGIDGKPFDLETSHLAIHTTKGLHVAPSSASANLPDACSERTLLEPHETVSCSLAFEVEQNVSDRLVYSMPIKDGVIEHVEAKVLAPLKCNAVAKHGTPGIERVSHEAAPELVREAIPDGTFFLVRSELFTDRGIPSNTKVPASTVILRDGMFEEVTWDEIVTRKMGSLVDDAAAMNVECISPARAIDPSPAARDRLYYSKIEGELILERTTPEGTLRRFYR